MPIDQIERRLQTEISPCFLCAKNRNDVKAPPAAHGQQAVPFLSPSLRTASKSSGLVHTNFPILGNLFPVAEIHFLLR